MRSQAQWWLYTITFFTVTTAFLLDDAQADGFTNLVGRKHRPAERQRRELYQRASNAPLGLSHIRRAASDHNTLASIIGRSDDSDESNSSSDGLTTVVYDVTSALKHPFGQVSSSDNPTADNGSTKGQSGEGADDSQSKVDDSDTSQEGTTNGGENQANSDGQDNQSSTDEEDNGSTKEGQSNQSTTSGQSNGTAGQPKSGNDSDNQQKQGSTSDGDDAQDDTDNDGEESKDVKDSSKASDASDSSKASDASDASKSSKASDASDASKSSKASQASDASKHEGQSKSNNNDPNDGDQHTSTEEQDQSQGGSKDGEERKTSSNSTQNGSTATNDGSTDNAKSKQGSSSAGTDQERKDQSDNKNKDDGLVGNAIDQTGLLNGKSSDKGKSQEGQGNGASQDGQDGQKTQAKDSNENSSNGSKGSQSAQTGGTDNSKDANNTSTTKKKDHDTSKSTSSDNGNSNESGSGNGSDTSQGTSSSNESSNTSHSGKSNDTSDENSSKGNGSSHGDNVDSSNDSDASKASNDSSNDKDTSDDASQQSGDSDTWKGDDASDTTSSKSHSSSKSDNDKSSSSGDEDLSDSDKQDKSGSGAVQLLVNGLQNGDKGNEHDSSTNADQTSKKTLPSDGSSSSKNNSTTSGSSVSNEKDNDATSTFNKSGNNSTLADGGSGDGTDAIGGSLHKGNTEGSGSSQFGQASDQYSNAADSKASDTSNGKSQQQSDSQKSEDASQTSSNSTVPVGSTSGGQPGSWSDGTAASAGQAVAAPDGGAQSGSSSTAPSVMTGSGSTGQTATGAAAGSSTQAGAADSLGSEVGSQVPASTTAGDDAKGGTSDTSTSTTESTESAGLDNTAPLAANGVIAGTTSHSRNTTNQDAAGSSTTKTKEITEEPSTTSAEGTETNEDPAPTSLAKPSKAFSWANSKQLLLPGMVSSQKNGTDNGDQPAKQDQVPSASSSTTNAAGPVETVQSSLPAVIPSTIVPSGASTVQPDGTTMVAILFLPVLSWSFLASSPDTVAQIFLYMPTLLSEAVGMDSDTVTTIRLQVHYDTDGRPTKRSESDSSQGKSLYLAYVPTETVTTLQGKIKNTTSEFYTQPVNPVAKSLAGNVDPSYDIMSMSSVGTANQAASQGDGDDKSKVLRNALIGVGTALACSILAFIIWRMWKRNQKRGRQEAVQNVMSRGVGQRGTIHSFGGHNSLRETWTPSVMEQERVLHGQLAETWEHNNQGQPQPAAVDHEPDMGFIGGLATQRAPSSRSHSDVFADQVTNRSSQETERSTGGNLNPNPQRNTLLSQLNSFDNRSVTSVASRMTEAQRIQQQYFEGQSNTSHLEGTRQPLAGGALYQGDYVRPPQNTTHHAYGARALESRSVRSDASRYSRNSQSSSYLRQPEIQCHSMCM